MVKKSDKLTQGDLAFDAMRHAQQTKRRAGARASSFVCLNND